MLYQQICTVSLVSPQHKVLEIVMNALEVCWTTWKRQPPKYNPPDEEISIKRCYVAQCSNPPYQRGNKPSRLWPLYTKNKCLLFIQILADADRFG